MKNRSAIRRLLLGLCLLWSLAVPDSRAERLPSFTLDRLSGDASVIVLGHFDRKGHFSVEKVLNGTLEPAETLSIDQAADRVAAARDQLKIADDVEKVEAVLFLSEKQDATRKLLADQAGLVVLQQDGVFAQTQQMKFPRYERSGEWTREPFLKAVQDSVRARMELDKILAEPRTPERAGALAAFAKKFGRPSDEEHDGFYGNYFLRKIALGLPQANPEESIEFVRALATAADARETTVMIELMGLLKLDGGAFDAVAPFLQHEHPLAVRHAAIQALASMNAFRATDHLAPLLTLDEPELRTILNSLRGASSSEPRLFNIKGVDAVEKLALEMRRKDTPENRQWLGNEGYAVVGAMREYAHPRLVPILFAWAFGGHVSNEQALSDLRSVTGLKLERKDREAWDAWWKKARPLLAPDYHLSTEEGCIQWMAAWNKADEPTRKILLTLWDFELEIPYPYLLKTADSNATVRTVLRTLWERGRLSGETKKAIVERFVQFGLVEAPDSRPEYRRYYAAWTTKFPFPKQAWVSYGMAAAAGDRLPELSPEAKGFDCSSSLHDVDGRLVPKAGRGNAKGPVVARGIIQMREVDHQSGGKIVWSIRREVEFRDAGK